MITVSSDIHRKIGTPKFASIHVGSGSDAGTFLVAPALASSGNTYKFCAPKRSLARHVVVSANALGIAAPIGVADLSFCITPDGIVFAAPGTPAISTA